MRFTRFTGPILSAVLLTGAACLSGPVFAAPGSGDTVIANTSPAQASDALVTVSNGHSGASQSDDSAYNANEPGRHPNQTGTGSSSAGEDNPGHASDMNASDPDSAYNANEPGRHPNQTGTGDSK